MTGLVKPYHDHAVEHQRHGSGSRDGLGEREAGQVRYWQYGQAENSPDLAISDPSRFLSPPHNDGHVALACQSRDGWRGVEPASELQGHHAHLQRIRHGVPEIPPVIRRRFIFSGKNDELTLDFLGGGTPCLAGTFVGPFLTSPGWTNVLLAGILTGFLPCGLVYGFLTLASSSASVVHGLLTMLAFGGDGADHDSDRGRWLPAVALIATAHAAGFRRLRARYRPDLAGSGHHVRAVSGLRCARVLPLLPVAGSKDIGRFRGVAQFCLFRGHFLG